VRLRTQALILIAPLAAASALAMAALSRKAAYDLLEEQTARRAEALATSVARAPATAAALRKGEEGKLLPILQGTLRAGAIQAAALKPDGTVTAHTNVALAGRPYVSTARRGRVQEAQVPVQETSAPSEELFMLSGKEPPQQTVGRIVVAVPLDEATATAAVMGRRVLAVIALVGLAALALAWILMSRVLRPAAVLAEAARRIAQGRLGESVPVPGGEELADLARSFNSMSAELARTTVSKDRFDRILAAMRDGLIVFGGDGRVQLVNEAAAEAAGTGWVGRQVQELFASGGEAFRPAALDKLGPGAAVDGLEAVLRSTGGDVPVLCSAARLSGVDDGDSFVLTFRDISNRKQAEAALSHYAEELSRSNAELEQFAYVASHDLQEPLRKVASYCQLLQRRYQGKLDEDADAFIGYAVEGAARMKQLIEDLLSYSRMTRKELVLAPVDLAVPVNRALENLELAVRDAGADVVVAPLPKIRGDAALLTQVFQNFLGNALKFRAERVPRVEVSAERSGDFWTVTVADNGIGIDPKHFDRLFQIFQRLHTRREYAGSGIGLSICRKIIERHGGRVWVESKPGEGARFRFTLKAADARP
jgi:PAS domain S-box-containing protein